VHLDQGITEGTPMEQNRLQIPFQRGDAGADDIQAVVDALLDELRDTSSEAAEAARTAGLDPREMADAKVEVREGAQGADPFLTPVLVGITVAVGSKIAESLWEDVLWPRIRRRLGVRALGERREAGD
jgi:hypothetical protein